MSTKIVVPELGESIVEATVARWRKQEGDPVAVGEAVVELETEKVNLEVSAEQAGILAKIERQEGEDVEIGQVLGLIEEGPAENGDGPASEDEEEKADSPKKEAPSQEADAPEKSDEKATPVAKRLAQAHQLDLANISPGDSGERITRQDVERYLDKQETAAKEESPQTKPKKQAESKPDTKPALAKDQAEREERVRMSRRRQTIARRLVEAQQTAAILTTFNEIDMSAVMDLRRRRQESFQAQHDIKLGFMSFFVKATIGALKKFPQLNAEIDGNELVLKHYYDIGMAIGAEEGLVVPVIRHAGRLSFAKIEQTINEYVEKVREGTLSLEDLRGGTFSITNGGVFGSLLSTPILNPPQVGILGLHKIEKRPVVIDDQIEIRPMMYVALSYDHRIVDGREAVQFLVRVKELIEDPEALLLAG